MIYALAIDELVTGRVAIRHGLNRTLRTPLDPVEAAEIAEQQRVSAEQRQMDEWGLSPEAIAVSRQMDRTLGDVTFGE